MSQFQIFDSVLGMAFWNGRNKRIVNGFSFWHLKFVAEHERLGCILVWPQLFFF